MLLSNDTAKELHDRYMSGEKVSDIAEDLGLKVGHVYRLFRENNLPTSYRKISREEVVSLHTRYLLGDSIEDLAAEIGMSYGGLYYIFSKDKLPVKESMGNGEVNDVRKQMAEELHGRYMNKETVHELASSLGVSSERIYNMFQTYNLPLRTLRSHR